MAMGLMVSLLLAPLAGGCASAGRLPEGRPARQLRTTLYIAIGVERAPDRSTDLEALQHLRAKVLQLQQSFANVHPGVQLEVLEFNNDAMLQEVRRRTRSGLGPDLVLVDGHTAESLYEQHLLRPIPLPNPASALLLPQLIPYVQAGPRQWFALPVGLEPQLACFDRRRMQRAPATLRELVEASSQGRRIGLPLEMGGLSWTMGSLGVLESLSTMMRSGEASAGQRQALRSWLEWLLNADLQLRIRFERSQGSLVRGLRRGELDWISCSSEDVAGLRSELGPHLGLAPLPSGPGGAASPVSTVRVWGFGRNSSARQRAAAEALVRFTLNPPIQRGFTIQTQGLLPVISSTSLPVASSANLAALLAAQEQANAAQSLTEPLIGLRQSHHRANRVLTLFLYGELDSTQATEALVQVLTQSQTPSHD